MAVEFYESEHLTNRFRAFLELAFREIDPTEESESYKEELLKKLLSSAEKYSAEGLFDEEIYRRSIEDLGNYKLKLATYKKAPQKIIKVVKRTLTVVMWAVLYTLLLTAVYLTVSFTVGPWSKTWLIMVDGILAGVVGGLIYLTLLVINKKYYATSRLIICIILTLSIVATYLTFSVMTPNAWKISWMIFLFLPIILSGSNLICSLITRGRSRLINLLSFIFVTASMLYVILGILGAMPWHPGWLLPTFALIFDITFGIISVKFNLFNKKID